MTDNEIIKALETCILGDCDVCNCKCGSVGDCRDTLNKHSLDLINRQQAEIERLEKHTEMYHEVRAEAIKEFAEKLKKRFYLIAGRCVVNVYQIDNLVKEMVGEE